MRCPLVFDGLQGLQKYRMSPAPIASFCLSSGSPSALPDAPKLAG